MIIDLSQYHLNASDLLWFGIALVVIGIVWALLRHKWEVMSLLSGTAAVIVIVAGLVYCGLDESNWVADQIHTSTGIAVSAIDDVPIKNGETVTINNVVAIKDGVGVRYDSMTMTRQPSVIIVELSEGKKTLDIIP